MQYQFTERYEYVKTIEFLNSQPLLNIQNIRFFKEEDITGTFVKKEFKYSFDNILWTNWELLTQPALTSIDFRNNPNFWLYVRYTRSNISIGNIQRWYLYYDSNIETSPVPFVDVSIDADTLKGEGPEYYLNRENHYGPFTGLNIENLVDGSTIGVYDSCVDTSIGTTFYFKRIGRLNNDISVTESGGKILIGVNRTSIDASISDVYGYIDGNITNIEASLGVLYDYVDGSLISRDASISQLYSMYGTYDSSIGFLIDWNSLHDSSISFLTAWNVYQDASITTLTNSLVLVENSLGNITIWNQHQDASIIELRSYLSKTDASIIRIDASLNATFNTVIHIDSSIGYITNINIVQDSSIISLNTRVLIHDVSIGNLYAWQTSQDTSISTIRTRTDASIVRMDASIANLYSRLSVTDSSVVTLYGRYIVMDASIANLTSWKIVQDASITSITQKNVAQDASIIVLRQWNVAQDSSITSLRNTNTSQDASIVVLRQWNVAQDVSITTLRNDIANLDVSIRNVDASSKQRDSVIDASIVVLRQWNVTQDASFIALRAYTDGSLSIRDTSLGNLSRWEVTQDASIDVMRQWNVAQDASITSIKNNIAVIEASIANIRDDQVINIGDGSVHVYSQRDASNNILLKTIKRIGPIELREDSSTITIDSSIVKLYDTSLGVSTYSPYTVGGFTKGTSVGELVNDTYTSILDRMIFPTLDPSLQDPYQTFTFDACIINMVDSNIYVTFTTTFDRGTIDVNGIFQNYRGGLPSSYTFTGPDISGNFTSTNLTYSFINEPVDVDLGITTWTSKVNYSQGVQPYNNKGAAFSTPLDASTTRDASLCIEGVWPIYATSVAINVLTQQSLASMISSSEFIISMVPETGGYKQRFDIPSLWVGAPTNKPLVGVQTYDEVAKTWNWQNGSQSRSLTFWDTSIATHVIGSNTVNYVKYTYNGTDRSSIQIKLLF